jgi:hypothetical protein
MKIEYAAPIVLAYCAHAICRKQFSFPVGIEASALQERIWVTEDQRDDDMQRSLTFLGLIEGVISNLKQEVSFQPDAIRFAMCLRREMRVYDNEPALLGVLRDTANERVCDGGLVVKPIFTLDSVSVGNLHCCLEMISCIQLGVCCKGLEHSALAHARCSTDD